MKKISLMMVMVILASSLLIACGNRTTDVEPYSLEGIKEKGKLIMGTSADFVPNEFHIMVDGKDTIVGYDIEIAKYIADKMGVELEIRDMEFNNLLAGLDTGILDIVIAGMVAEPQREANFTKAYDVDGVHKVVIRNADKDKYKSEADLNGAVIGAQTASIQSDMAAEIEGSTVRELQALNTLVMELKTEKIDAMVMSNESALSYVEANDDIMLIEDIVLTHDGGGASIALKMGNDQLTEYLNEAIDELIEQGLVEKWKEEAKALVAAGCKFIAEGSNMGSTQEAIDIFEAERKTSSSISFWVN